MHLGPQAKVNTWKGWPVPVGATVTPGQPAWAFSLLVFWALLVTPQVSDRVPLTLWPGDTSISAQVG